MASTRTLRLLRSESPRPGTRLLTLESDQTVGFTGGQFIIVATGLMKADGTPLKRAYSLLSPDADQKTVQLAFRQVGVGTSALANLEPGDELTYSGPWGKLSADSQPADCPSLVVATDTGITAALGLLSSRGFAPRLSGTTLVLLENEHEALFSKEQLDAQLPHQLACFERHGIPKVGSAHRSKNAIERLGTGLSQWESSPMAVWMVGDGDVVIPIQRRFERRAQNLESTAVSLECFFNRPDRP